MIEFPLGKANRILLVQAFRHVPRVDLSIDCVIEAQMGRVYVDDIHHPTAFQIQVGPFNYFAGDVTTQGAQLFLDAVDPYRLYMPSAPGWMEAFLQRYPGRWVNMQRYSYSSEALDCDHLGWLVESSSWRDRVCRMDLSFVQGLWGQEHFIELSDFDSPEDFIRRGVGYFIRSGEEIAGAAYASLVCSRGIEVSLYVEPAYRRQGMATVLSARLLRWCLEHHADANWDAANPESCRLAEKLGYLPRDSYLAYYLNPERDAV